jgi:predicted aspartyl protease
MIINRTITRFLGFTLFVQALFISDTYAQNNAVADDTQCLYAADAELPISEVHGHFVTSISMNDRPVLMLIDTGASRTGLSPKFAESLGLPQDQHKLIHVAGIGGRSSAQHPFLVGSIRLGSQELENYDVMATSVVRPEFEADPASPVGLLGTDLLSKYDVEFDFPNQKMTLYTMSHCDEHFAPKWSGAFQSFRPVRTPQSSFIIPVELNGHPVRALIDTGSNTSSMTREAALVTAGVDGTVLDQEPASNSVGSNGVAIAGHHHRFDTMRIGTATFKNVHVTVQNSILHGEDMLLGMDFLRWRKVWISYKTNQVFIQYNTDQHKRLSIAP